ncbi:helix-turn-helix domain-containing protein [Chryseobacterium sp. 7]|uniref:helix-turn-helix domain-containing protein n=1 Tax=Chryseobacterium sp. 7 TaxID=2035214 RepID=UPI000EB25F06|nr:helix-turn-helix domain-containing protein [Chryseobacterium sp. 7]
MNIPDYKKIYQDMIRMKYPDKEILCNSILKKNHLGSLDIMRINDILTGRNDISKIMDDPKLRSYDRKTILKILDYQKQNKLTNSQLALHFRTSRNTITNWKKVFFSKVTYASKTSSD